MLNETAVNQIGSAEITKQTALDEELVFKIRSETQ
jgi:hypothetical protein